MDPGTCVISYTGTIPSILSSAITADYAINTRTFTVDTSSVSHPGVHTLTVSALTPSGSPIPGQTTSIQLTIIDPCEPPATTTASTVTDQSYTLRDPALVITWD